MSLHRAAVFALVAALVAPPSFAQDLDIPVPNAGKTKSKGGKKRGSAKKASAKKAAPAADELDVPMPASKPATAKKPALSEGELDVPVPSSKPATAKKPAPASSDDELIPSIGGKTELVVKLSGGIKGARLMVDNKDVGSLPLTGPLQVEAGEHTLVVRRPGYAEFTRRVTAQKNKPTEVSITLEAVAGVVTVTSDVQGATVAINGQEKGSAPLSGLVLKPGSYEIVVSKPGYQPEKKNLNVRAGKDYTVAANLRPAETQPVAGLDAPKNPVLTPSMPVAAAPTIPLKNEPEASTSQPWFKRWYVWAGVGVVAAAAAGAVVATQGGSAKTLDADFICGGACDGTINGIRAGAR